MKFSLDHANRVSNHVEDGLGMDREASHEKYSLKEIGNSLRRGSEIFKHSGHSFQISYSQLVVLQSELAL